VKRRKPALTTGSTGSPIKPAPGDPQRSNTRKNNMRKRPIGFSILAIILWWLTLAAAVKAALPLGGMGPTWVFAYALSAFMAALGLWKVKTWAFQAFLAWSAVVVLMTFAGQHGVFQIPMLKFAIFLCLILILLSSGAIYIRKTLRNAVEPRHAADRQ